MELAYCQSLTSWGQDRASGAFVVSGISDFRLYKPGYDSGKQGCMDVHTLQMKIHGVYQLHIPGLINKLGLTEVAQRTLNPTYPCNSF